MSRNEKRGSFISPAPKIRKWKAVVWMEEETEGYEEFELLKPQDLTEAFKTAKRGIEAGWQGFRVVDFHVYLEEDEEEVSV